MKMLMKGNSLGKSRKGFTLIELLIVMVILAILAGIVIISIGGVIGRGQATAYNADREQIQSAVSEFMTRPTDPSYGHVIGAVPLVDPNTSKPATDWNNSPNAIPGESYFVVAMCPLTVNAFPKGILKQVPATASMANTATSGDNDPANVPGVDTVCLNRTADEAGSYTWYTTLSGDIISLCVPGTCTHNDMDGFQDVYP